MYPQSNVLRTWPRICLFKTFLMAIDTGPNLIGFVVLRDNVAVYGRREMKFDVKTPG